MACGVPICCFALGAPAESVARYPRGRVFALGEYGKLLAEIESFLEDMRQAG